MSENTIRNAEEALAEGLAIWEIALRSGEPEAVIQRASDLLYEALSLKPDPITEMKCRLTLGVALLKHDESFQRLSDSPLSGLGKIKEAVDQLELALKLDAERGTEFFFDRMPQSMALLRLSVVWQMQSFYIKKQFGLERKLQYLQDKENLLEYLGGIYPPTFCNSLAFYYKDVGDRDNTLKWLKLGAVADDYGDIEHESSFHQMAAHSKQSCQKGIHEMTTPKKSKQAAQSDAKSGCFIATAAYGSPIEPEVMAFRQFRDETLLTSKLGSAFVHVYYLVSPTFANIIRKSDVLKAATRRILLQPILGLIRKQR